MISLYSEKNNIRNTQLPFHAGQLLAIAGDYPAAVGESRQSLSPPSTNEGDFLWDDYVLGTIAFLERDKTTLIRHLEVLRTKQDFNAPNLKILQLLVAGFEKSYDDALK